MTSTEIQGIEEERERIKRFFDTADVFQEIAAEVLNRKLGTLTNKVTKKEILDFYSFIYYEDMCRELREQIGYYLEESGYFCSRNLEKARLTNRKNQNNRSFEIFKKVYSLLEAYKIGEPAIGPETLDTILWNNRREKPKKRKFQTEYQTEIVTGSDAEKGYIRKYEQEYNVFLDTTFGVVLLHKQKPCAILEIDIFDPETLYTKQMQGIIPVEEKIAIAEKTREQGHAGALGPYYWTNVLQEIAEAIGAKNNFKRIGIQSAKNNEYCYKKWKDTGKVHASLDALTKIYDATAQRMGYQLSKDGIWYKKLGSVADNE